MLFQLLPSLSSYSSVMSTNSRASHSSSRWRDLATLDVDEARRSPAPSRRSASPLANVGGLQPGGDDAYYLRVTQGKSVSILLDDKAYQHFCCATVGAPGNNIVCLKPSATCTTKTHIAQREKNATDPLSQGIYVKAPGGEYNIYTDPVGPLSLLSTHRSDILTYEEKNIGEWPILFNEWAQSSTAGEATVKRTSRKNASIYSTPIVADRSSSASINLASMFETEPIKPELIDEGLEIYTQVWKNAAMDEGTELPNFDMAGFLRSQSKRLDAVSEGFEELLRDLAEHKRWCESAFKSTGQAISDIKVTVGETPSDWTFGSTLWRSLKGLSIQLEGVPLKQQVEENFNAVKNMEDEINEMFNASKSFRVQVESSIRTINTKLGSSIPSATAAPPPSTGPTARDLEDLYRDFQSMQQQLKEDAARISSLESKLKLNEISYRLTSGTTLRGSADVSTWLAKIGASDIDFGGFCDVYTLFVRIQKCIEGVESVADYLKKKKDAMGVKLSEDEAFVLYGFQDTAPPIFGGVKTEKTAIALLASYAKWRVRSQNTGLAFTIENELQQIEDTIRSIIYTNYQSLHSDLLSLAGEVITTAVSFARKFVSWVDSTYETMIHGGNAEKDVWELLSRVMRALFDEGLGPKRITPTGTSFTSNLERTSVVIWGVIKTHIATKEMLLGDLRDQPIVTGNYAKWLVNHSGKKDALAVKKEVEKVSNQLAALKEVAATKKALSSVENVANAAKKTADKAFNRQNT